MSPSCFLGKEEEMDAFALLYFAKILGLHVRGIGVCGYGYGYGYGSEISYPRQDKVTFDHAVRMLSSSRVVVFLVKLILLLIVSRAPPGELFTRCFTPGSSCTPANSFCEHDVCTCLLGYFATSDSCCESACFFTSTK